MRRKEQVVTGLVEEFQDPVIEVLEPGLNEAIHDLTIENLSAPWKLLFVKLKRGQKDIEPFLLQVIKDANISWAGKFDNFVLHSNRDLGPKTFKDLDLACVIQGDFDHSRIQSSFKVALQGKPAAKLPPIPDVTIDRAALHYKITQNSVSSALAAKKQKNLLSILESERKSQVKVVHCVNVMLERGCKVPGANKLYESLVLPMVARRGGGAIHVQMADGLDWDVIKIIEYPGRSAFLDMVTSQEYQDIADLKIRGTKDSLVVMTIPIDLTKLSVSHTSKL